jgi:hypothetical protein
MRNRKSIGIIKAQRTTTKDQCRSVHSPGLSPQYSLGMSASSDQLTGIGLEETVMEFSIRARKIRAEAESLSIKTSCGFTELDRWTAIARQRGMTWVEGLQFSIDGMKEKRRIVI